MTSNITKGLERLKEEGIKEGIKEGTIEIAKKCLKRAIP